MKIMIKAKSATLESPVDIIAGLSVQVESQSFPLSYFLTIAANRSIGSYDDGGDLAVNIFVDCPVYFQSVDGSGDISATMTVISNDNIICMKNFSVVDVNQFNQGKSYLILYADGVVCDMIPQNISIPIAGSDFPYNPDRYCFVAYYTQNVLGGETIQVLQYDFLVSAAQKMDQAKAFRKSGELQLYGQYLSSVPGL